MVSQSENLSHASRSGVEALPQSSVVPYRRVKGEIEVCLITSRRKKRWIFPKGPVEDRIGLIEAARKAAADEAGLAGSIESTALGGYKRLKEGRLYKVHVYLMQVASCEKVWLESRVRERRWVTIEGARRSIGKPELLDMLERALQQIS